jgi:hypothetical protein
VKKRQSANWCSDGCQAKDLLRRCSKDPRTHKNRGKCTPIEAYIVSSCPADANAARGAVCTAVSCACAPMAKAVHLDLHHQQCSAIPFEEAVVWLIICAWVFAGQMCHGESSSSRVGQNPRTRDPAPHCCSPAITNMPSLDTVSNV